MWPFKRKKTLSEIPPRESQQWLVSQGQYNGTPLVVRHNTTAAEWKGHKSLGIKLGFTIPFKSPNKQGLPDPEENKLLSGMEDLIENEVLAATPGVFAMVLSTGIMKEFVFYIPEGVDIESIHKGLMKKIQTHDVQCMANREPDWSSFEFFAKT